MGPPTDSEDECRQRYKHAQDASLCPAAWDTLVCWPPTPAGTVVSYPCTSLFPQLAQANDTAAVAFRRCEDGGQWSRDGWTNYSQCVQLDIQLQEGLEGGSSVVSPLTVSIVVFVVSLVSLFCLCVAFFVFTAFRSLQCSRIHVHRNLVLSLILHALLMLLVSSAGLSKDMNRLLENTAWLCRGVLSLKSYSAMSSVHWMFVEGLLLHASVAVSVFESKPFPFALYHAIGWGIPSVCVMTWLLLMSVYWSKESCWRGYGNSPFVWIITGPMMAALLVNAVFLVNIIRILVTKMRTNVAIETKQVKKAARATALLFPLLGITHLLFCVNPGGELEPVYMLVNALLQSSQGLFVAVLYCFLNSEVQSALSKAYTRRRSSVWSVSRRGQRSSRMFGTSVTTAQPPEAASRLRQEEEEETAFTTPPRRVS